MQKSLYFPEIEGTRLSPDGKKVKTTDLLHGKISLVGMLSTRVSEVSSSALDWAYQLTTIVRQAHVESYAKSVLQEFQQDPLFQFVQVNCQENKLKWILVSIFIASARSKVPLDQHDKYLVSTQDLERVREV